MTDHKLGPETMNDGARQPWSRRDGQKRSHGQSLVEFALVGPIFFVVLFGALNAGLLMFSINAADQTANVGAHQLAALGDYDGAPPAGSGLPNPSNADAIALDAMQRTGLDSAGTASALSYRITKLDPTTLQPYYGSTNCTIAMGGCYEQYTVATQSWSGDWAAGTGQRNTASATADYVQLDVNYTYTWLMTGASLHLTATRVFRLEPQS
jgi:Flp pilus assembly protein TadG